MFKNVDPSMKSAGFGFKAFKKFPEIIPLVSIMGIATVGVASFITYALFKKTDVQIDRRDLTRWEKIDVNQPQKILTFNQTYGEDPAITALKQELAEAYKNK